jgi:G:T/U-mismatch repair DNA glycosylase
MSGNFWSMFKTIDLERKIAEKEKELVILADTISLSRYNDEGSKLIEKYYERKYKFLHFQFDKLNEILEEGKKIYPYKLTIEGEKK